MVLTDVKSHLGLLINLEIAAKVERVERKNKKAGWPYDGKTSLWKEQFCMPL